jgi:arginine/ornithine transport system permease protein
MAFAGFLYLMISSVSLLLLRKAEARYSVGVKRGNF